MGKETFIRIKKSLATLLVVLFLATVTSMTVSANYDHFNPTWNQHNQNAYKSGQSNTFSTGYVAGFFYGYKDGVKDCKVLLPHDGNPAPYHKPAPPGATPRQLGNVDGYNDGVDLGYSSGYDSGYDNC